MPKPWEYTYDKTTAAPAAPAAAAGVKPWEQTYAKPEAPAPSLMSRIANSQQVKDLMDPGKAVQALSDVGRVAADDLTFGFADPAIGYLSGQDERGMTQQARQRMGWAATPLDLTAMVEGSPALAGKVVSGAKGFVPAVSRAVGYGAEGAGQAALSAVGHGETDPGKIGEQAAIGSALGAGGSAVGGKVASWAERRALKAAQPFKTSADIEAASGAKYKQVDQSGASYPRDQTDTLLQGLDRTLVENTATPGLDDRAIALVNRLKKDWAGKPINPTELDKVRRWVDEKLIAGNPRGPDAQLGYRLKDEIDNFSKQGNVIDPLTGQPNAQVNQDLLDARSLKARQYRSEAVDTAAAKAQKQADKTGSALTGGNIENATRQQFDKLQAKIPEGAGRGGWGEDAAARIKQIAEGTTGRNIGRFGGAFSPLRGSVPALAHMILGPFTGGLSTAVGIGGEVAAQLGRRATARQVEDLAALVRDPSGRGLTSDPAKIQQARDLMARIMVSGQRTSQMGGGQ